MNEQFKAWKYKNSSVSLEESHASIPTHSGAGFWRRLLAFIGPGYMVAVGYMDPGNWATSLAGGSKFGYALLSVVLISNIMAILLQALCVRLGIATGRDLAQACRDAYPKPISFMLWIMAEAAIIATDLAEVIGTAIGINLLFGVPLEWAVLITAADVFLILYLQKMGFRYLEAFVIALMLVIMGCFAFQIALASPEFGPLLQGLVPTTKLISDPDMLYLALGILGATVMPHNLYLHSSIVQTRAIGSSENQKRSAIKMATIDSTIALMLALFVNGSILVLAASTFHKAGNTQVAEIQEAYQLLSPMLGSSIAATLFAVALLCCGLNSTVTATLAGQIVMEGFISIKIKPWLRRLITRIIAIIPAVVVTILFGQSGTAKLLVLSQVILSLQLPFAIIPLVMFTSSKSKMGAFVSPKWLTITTGAIATIIVVLNVKLIIDFLLG